MSSDPQAAEDIGNKSDKILEELCPALMATLWNPTSKQVHMW